MTAKGVMRGIALDPSLLVASRNDPYMAYSRAVALARNWGSWLVDAGRSGHINADSDLGDWRFGQVTLSRLLSGALVQDDRESPTATHSQPVATLPAQR